MKKIFVALVILFAMCGCQGQEPESREYVLGMYIEKNNNLTLGTAKLSKANDELRENVFYSGKGETLAQAVKEIDGNTGGSIYMGHTIMCVIDEETLKNENTLKQLLSFSNSNTDLSKGVIVVCTDDMEALKSAKWSGGDIVAFVQQYYKKNGVYTGSGYPLDINRLTHILTETHGQVAIPFIHCDDEKINIQGGVVIKDYKKTGRLDKNSFKYMLWLMPEKDGSAVIKTDTSVVEVMQKHLTSYVENGSMVFDIKAQAEVIQGSKNDVDREYVEQKLKKEITNLISELVEMDSDCIEVSSYYNRITGEDKSLATIPIDIKTDIEWKGV